MNQSKYIKELLKKFGMEGAKEIGTPMSPFTKLDKDESGKSVDSKVYRGMIGSLRIPEFTIQPPSGGDRNLLHL